MKRFIFPLVLICSALTLATVDVFFERYHLYFLLPWLDIPMHTLSGFLISLTVLTIVFHQRFALWPFGSPLRVLLIALSAAFVGGVLWEVFAPLFGHLAPAAGGWTLDTTKDIVNDLLGGACAALFFIGRGYNTRI